MRKAILITLTGSLMLGGCSQISSVGDALWGGTKSVAKWAYSPVKSLLRDTPEEEYVFEGSDYAGGEVVMYDTAAPAIVQGPVVVEMYDTPTTYTYSDSYSQLSSSSYAVTGSGYYVDAEEPVQRAATASPNEIAFVKLNGDSNMSDWQFCEVTHRGYWLIDAAGGRMNPDFEVCMRNRGYVLESELALYGGYGPEQVASPGYRSLP